MANFSHLERMILNPVYIQHLKAVGRRKGHSCVRMQAEDRKQKGLSLV